MFRKSEEIFNSAVLLKIDSQKNMISNYLRIFMLIIFVIFFGIMSLTASDMIRQPVDYLFSILAYFFLCLIIAIVFVRLKENSLVFTEKGITDGMFIFVFWEELEFYNFGILPDIGPNRFRKTLRILSKKPPFYGLRFMGLPRDFYDRGLFFSDADIAKAEEILRSKGISKKP